ncbi:MAG: Mur ligase family protein, partial [Pseudomonadota bacterium]
MIWDSKSLEKALGVRVAANIEAGQVKFNSMDVDKDDIFIALPGKRDGHEFANDALSRGARCAIVSKDIPNVDRNKLINVDDTMLALNNLAEYKRTNSKAKFIAVTGTVGKTSTREIIKTMLLAYGKTYSSVKSFNNYLGVPLTLASMPDDTEYAVIERRSRGRQRSGGHQAGRHQRGAR